MVGLFWFEPKTSSMSTKRSNQLSYNPMSDECIIHDMREICKMLFCNFLHIARQMRYLHAAARYLIYMDRSFAQRRRRAYLLQIHLSGLPKANKCRSCFSALVRKLCVRGDISEIRHHYTNEYPALQDPVRAGCSYHCSLVGLSGFEPETSSMWAKRSDQLSYSPMWYYVL